MNPKVSGWPIPEYIEFSEIARVRVGGHALRTLWLDMKDGTEYFIGHVDTPMLATLIAMSVTRYLLRLAEAESLSGVQPDASAEQLAKRHPTWLLVECEACRTVGEVQVVCDTDGGRWQQDRCLVCNGDGNRLATIPEMSRALIRLGIRPMLHYEAPADHLSDGNWCCHDVGVHGVDVDHRLCAHEHGDGVDGIWLAMARLLVRFAVFVS